MVGSDGVTHSADFLVIGAGIAGASVAAELATDQSVLLLEAESQPGFHATGRSAALFIEMYGNRVIRALTRASRSALFEPPADFTEAPLTRQRGGLYVASDGQQGRLDAFAEQEDVRPFARKLDAAAALALCPILRPDYVVAGLLDPIAADIDAHALHYGYLRQFRRRRGTLLTTRRVDAVSRTNGRWRVQAGDARFDAAIIINAAGAWSDLVAGLAGAAPLGLDPLRRTALLVDPPPGQAIESWPMVIDIDEQFYFKPDAGRLLLSPADETPSVPCDAQPEEWDIALAVDRVSAAAGIAVRSVRRAWAGLRTFAPDRSPVVGFDPLVPGFFWLAGQGGYGLQTAPAMARVAAALACGRPIPADIADFGVEAASLSPARFG